MERFHSVGADGRATYQDSAGRLIRWSTDTGHPPSSRRFVVMGDPRQIRCRWAGMSRVGTEVMRVNVPRRMRDRVDMYALMQSIGFE